MAIIQGPTDLFSLDLLRRIHDFENDVFKIALYSSSASLGPETTAYSTTNEVTGVGYSAGGATLSGVTLAQSNGIAYVDWSDATWPSSTITAQGALIYNSTRSDKSVWVLNFGIDRVSSSSTFTVRFPVAAYDSSIIRVGQRR